MSDFKPSITKTLQSLQHIEKLTMSEKPSLPLVTDISTPEPEKKKLVKSKTPRPFSFDADKPGDGGSGIKIKFAGNKLKLASMVVLGVAVISTGYMILSSAEGDAPPVIPFATRKADESNLKPLSESRPNVDETSAAKQFDVPVAPVVESIAQTPDMEIESPPEVEESAIAIQEVTPSVKKAPLPVVERIQVAMLLKEIDERKLLVEHAGVEYIVRAGQKLPGGDTVFIGFNRQTSMMMTSTGDQYVATSQK